MLYDLRYALRGIRKNPVFTVVVAVSIALGIAANTTVFSMVNGLLLGVLPVADPGGLYSFSSGRTLPYADYRDFRDQCGAVFEGLAGHFPLAPASLAGAGSAERVWGQLVSGNYFQVTGAPLALGRGITPEEDAIPGRDPVVVLGSALWRRRFGADPSVVGRTVFFNGHRYTVVGVTAPGFQGTDRGILSEFWAPLSMTSDFTPEMEKSKESRTAYWIVINGRLRPGVSRQQAVAAMNVVHSRIHETHRKGRQREPVTLTAAGGFPGKGQAVAGVMTLLMVVVGLVLLVACANVANLMLARAVGRQQEIGTRLALGADRGRLIRQLLMESVLLAGLGAAGGFVIAFFAARALSSIRLPIPIPFAFDFTPDHRVLGYTAALAVFTGILFGLAPAIAASRPDLVSTLKNAGPGFGRFRRLGLRNLLVGVQVTLSAVLLIGAGLFLRSLQSAASLELGIRPENVLMMAVDPKTNGYSDERFRGVLSLLGLTLLVKTSGDPAQMIHPVRQQIEALDPHLAVFSVDTLTHHVSKAFLVPRLCAMLFGIFGLIGLTLASVGLYGVVSYSVRSRTREIGIRMALGARAAGIVRLVVRQGLAIVIAGLALGLGLAFALSRFTASLLYGISATDAVTFVGVPLVLLAAALLAVLLPARRAAAVQPMSALRFE